MFNVDIENRPTYTVAVPSNVQDCYDFIEYATFDQMLYYSLKYSYDMISNPHLREEGNKISIDPHSLVKYSSSFPSHTKKEWYSSQKPKIHLQNKSPSLDHYKSMTQIQRDLLMKSLYVNENDRNIFNVLYHIHAEIQVQKINLQHMKFTFNDEDVRCKFSVVYTSFRIAHPNLYGHLDRSSLNYQYYFMFNKFDDGDDSYYLKFIYCSEQHLYGYI
jgi:hypothetical protein